MATHPKPMYKRVLLKLSGEALMGNSSFGIDPNVITDIAQQIKEVHESGVSIALVVGGGNFFRGSEAHEYGMERAVADYMGMLATVINGLALQSALEKTGVSTRAMSAIEMQQVAEPYIRRRALRHLEKGRVVIFAAGTGNPYFSTDTAAALRAMESHAEVILKATKVDGVYDSDPVKDANAKKFDSLSYLEVLKRKLKVMDSTAISLCMDNELPIIIFNLNGEKHIKRVIDGESIGTFVGTDDQVKERSKS